MSDQLPQPRGSIGPDLVYALRRLAERWLPDHGLVELRSALAIAAQLAQESDSSEDLSDQLRAIASGARSLAPEPSSEPEAGASSKPAPDSPPTPTAAPARKAKSQAPQAKSAAA
jgi:hypothetical protein